MHNSNTEREVLVARAIVWVAGQAIEFVPVIGPLFKVVNLVNSVVEIRKAYREVEQQ